MSNESLLNQYQEAINPYGNWICQWVESSQCSLRKAEKELFYLLNESMDLKSIALFLKKSLSQIKYKLWILAIKIRQDYPYFRKWITSNREENFLTAHFASFEISSRLYNKLNSTGTRNLKELLEEYEVKDLLKLRGFGKKGYFEFITLLHYTNSGNIDFEF
ncbi:MAG: hypothetical protein H0V01_10375 [Bacteroidetes bacterium]|nr:hypothetical protein [Bacteroidota bacterium]MDQ3192085.1 hypothetical protein [Bacteroidota bacterium]HET6243581.1 DNA-directed RNA polymerase subunit alpha C-terminal domain-containing protein [Bacteroidia bacterium]